MLVLLFMLFMWFVGAVFSPLLPKLREGVREDTYCMSYLLQGHAAKAIDS